MTDRQPPPTPNRHPSIPSLVIEDLAEYTHLGPRRHDVARRVAERQQAGIAHYGTSLQPWNGRDALLDGDDELLDACQYFIQKVYELEHDAPDDWRIPVLRAMYADLLHMACAVVDMRAADGSGPAPMVGSDG